MANSNFNQPSFLGGEWSAFIQGRIDRKDYQTAMNVCRNSYPLEEGAWIRRSGTRFAATTLNGLPGRVIKFDFENAEPYVMEFTDGNLRFFAAMSGNFALDSTPIGTPYINGDWKDLRSVQANLETVLLHGSYQPRLLSVTTLPTPTIFAGFNFAAISFTDGPYMDPPTDASTLTPSAKTGTINLTASALTSINGGSGFLSTDIGRSIRLLSEPPIWAVGTTYAAGDSVTYNGAYFTSLIGSNVGNEPDIAIAAWSINTSAATWSWGTIQTITSTHIVTFKIMGADLLYTGAISTWQLGLYSATTGWPTCGCYYEGRLWLAGAVSNRVDASNVNDLFNMTPTAPDGTVADNNSMSYIFNSEGSNPIFWMKGTQQGIICGTQPKEWLIHASTLGDPLTPTSIQAHPVTSFGSENIEAINTQLTNSFVQRFGRKVLEYFPDVFSGRYSAPNLSETARHLFTSGIAEIRYQQELLPIIWARCNDGSLVGCTYNRKTLFSTQGAEYSAWHRHDLGSGRVVESITVGPSADGTLDTLAMVTNDPVTNVRHVEFMESIFDIDSPITSAWFLDDATTPTSGSITVSGTAGTTSTLTLNGLSYLNGKTVSVWVGGMDAGDYTVSGGSVIVDIDRDQGNPDALSTAYLFSITSLTAYGTMALKITGGSLGTMTVPCIVGFTFTSQGQCLRPDTMEQVRSPIGPGPQKVRRVSQFGALVTGTQRISFGTDFKKLHAAQFASLGGKPYNNTQLFSGPYWATIDDTSSMDGMICWQVTRPYPACVNSISGWMQAQER